MRRKRVDANQSKIVEELRSHGYSVELLHSVGEGVPDLLVGATLDCGYKVNLLVEVKTEKGSLNDRQKKWHEKWRGQVLVASKAGIVIAYIASLQKARSDVPGITDQCHTGETDVKP